jgi:hypothetical protein
MARPRRAALRSEQGQAILKAAMRVCATRGVAAATIRAIAREANIAQGTWRSGRTAIGARAFPGMSLLFARADLRCGDEGVGWLPPEDRAEAVGRLFRWGVRRMATESGWTVRDSQP